MVALKCGSGTIEVRLLKPPFDAKTSVAFDEHASLILREPELQASCTRYIIPETTTYAIEITIKKGYKLGSKYTGFWVTMQDSATNHEIISQLIEKECPKDVLKKDQRILIERASTAVVDGELRASPQLAFQAIQPGESGHVLVCIAILTGYR